jgi:hypothetical protein
MAFKRSAVRLRLAPPNNTLKFQDILCTTFGGRLLIGVGEAPGKHAGQSLRQNRWPAPNRNGAAGAPRKLCRDRLGGDDFRRDRSRRTQTTWTVNDLPPNGPRPRPTCRGCGSCCAATGAGHEETPAKRPGGLGSPRRGRKGPAAVPDEPSDQIRRRLPCHRRGAVGRRGHLAKTPGDQHR